MTDSSTTHSSIVSGSSEDVLSSSGYGAQQNSEDQVESQQDVTGNLNPDDERKKSTRVKSTLTKFGIDIKKLDRVAKGYKVVDKIEDSIYEQQKLIRTFENGKEFSLEYLQRNGFDKPMLFRNRDGLGEFPIKKTFTLADILRLFIWFIRSLSDKLKQTNNF